MSKPRILYVPANETVHDEEYWSIVNENFELFYYDFNTIEEYMEELKKPGHGRIGHIEAVFRPTWLKANPYVHHYILRGEAVRLLPESVKIVVQSGHGYDIVDIDYLNSRNIVFCNSPNTCSRATADIASQLIINSFRYTTYAEYCVRFGNYSDSQLLASVAENPENMTLGIIGLGDIGKLVAKTCQSLGMNIIYHNRSRKLAIEKEFPVDSLKYYSNFDDFLGQADCVLVMCPYTKETRHLINFDTFKNMKSKVRLVNVARGPIVQQDAIIDALERGQLVGAGFDVHEFEPEIDERLLKNWKICLLPHLGVVSRDSWKAFEKKCVKNLMAFFYKQGELEALNVEILDKI